MYDIDGGLLEATASLARRHFDFLDKWSFVLNRHNNESECSGCLHLDGRGDQRMEMLGIHNRLRNAFQPPDKARADFVVANKGGDLDAYVIHFDDLERFGGAALKPIWEGLSERMKALLPSSMESLSQALRDAGVRERLYSQAANECVSTDLLVNNVGVSSAYQSPPHFDVGDIGWTFAFACKCDHNCKVRVRPPKDVEVEEEEEEVEDGGVFDGVAVEEGSEYDSEDEPLRKRLEEDEPLRKRIKSRRRQCRLCLCFLMVYVAEFVKIRCPRRRGVVGACGQFYWRAFTSLCGGQREAMADAPPLSFREQATYDPAFTERGGYSLLHRTVFVSIASWPGECLNGVAAETRQRLLSQRIQEAGLF